MEHDPRKYPLLDRVRELRRGIFPSLVDRLLETFATSAFLRGRRLTTRRCRIERRISACRSDDDLRRWLWERATRMQAFALSLQIDRLLDLMMELDFDSDEYQELRQRLGRELTAISLCLAALRLLKNP